MSPGFVEGVYENGEDYAAVVAADEIEAAFLLDELELGWHWGRGTFRARRRWPRKAAAKTRISVSLLGSGQRRTSSCLGESLWRERRPAP